MQTGAKSKPTRRRRRLVPLFLSIPILLVLAWLVYWYVAYRMVDGYVIEASVASREGVTAVTCAERSLNGFPLRIRIGCADATAEGVDGTRFGIAGFLATAPLYNPGWVEAQAEGPLIYDGINHQVNADWTAAYGDLLAGFGGVNRGKATLANVDLDVLDAVDEAHWGATADHWTTEIYPAEEAEAAMRVLLSTQNLMIEIGGRFYPSLSGTATLTVLDMGSAIDRLPAVMLGDWLGAGGAFRVDHMALTSGRLVAEVTGDGVLEVDGTLSGAVVLRYSGEEDLPQFVSAIFPWLEDEADIIAEAIAALSQPIEMRGEPARQVRLILDHGAVKIGLIPIPLTIPSIGPLDHFLRAPA